MAINEDIPGSVPTEHFDANAAENKKGQMLVIYLPEGSVIVDRTDLDLTKAPQHITERIIAAPDAKRDPSGSQFMPRRHRRAHRARVHRRRHLRWVHGVNIVFITYLVLVSVLPSVMSSFFGLSIYASKGSHPAVSISSGDLMICREIPAVGVKVNDVVLIRGANTWTLDARQVTANSIDANQATLTTAATSGSPIQTTMTVPVASPVYKVSTIVPKLGYLPMFLSATFTKALGAFVILILNLSVYFRRARRSRFISDIG